MPSLERRRRKLYLDEGSSFKHRLPSLESIVRLVRANAACDSGGRYAVTQKTTLIGIVSMLHPGEE